MSVRGRVRDRARAAIARGDATAWFDELYKDASGDPDQIPWADLAPNPSLVEAVRTGLDDARGGASGLGRVLVIGCGLGDDAEWLATQPSVSSVVAFDVSETAIAWCRRRFPTSRVRYEAADLLAPPRGWLSAFDFVFEAYTLQALPVDVRARATTLVGGFVAPGGRLLVIARSASAPLGPEDGPPWPLTKDEVLAVAGGAGEPNALALDSLSEVDDEGTPRFVAWFARSS